MATNVDEKWYARLIFWKKDLGISRTIYMTSPDEHRMNVCDNESIQSVVERAAKLLGIDKEYTPTISFVFSNNKISGNITVQNAGICDGAEFGLSNTMEALQAQEIIHRAQRIQTNHTIQSRIADDFELIVHIIILISIVLIFPVLLYILPDCDNGFLTGETKTGACKTKVTGGVLLIVLPTACLFAFIMDNISPLVNITSLQDSNITS